VRLNLVPRERRFYELFSEQGELVRQALEELRIALCDERSHHQVMRDLEHRCDDITHELYNLANSTFVPPFDTADMLHLAHSIDEILDLAEEVSDKIDLYEIHSITGSAKDMGQCLADAGSRVSEALDHLSDFAGIGPALEDIHRLENDGDRITRDALRKLFDAAHQSPAELIKWKDLYALLESTLDECESVAEILETMSIKNA